MANIAITSDAWTEISITSGTVQNISATADIELSAEQTDNSGVVLKPSEIYQWDNETIYARAVTEDKGALRVVNFKKAAGGGGSYVLPVATASKLGGVKVGTNLSIAANGVLTVTDGTPIGRVIYDAILRDGYIRANGAENPSASTNYPALLSFLNSHSALLAADAAAYAANPLLFLYDSDADTLTVPNYVDLVPQGAANLGTIAAGLPNLKGGITSRGLNNVDVGGACVFAGSSGLFVAEMGTYSGQGVTAGANYTIREISFDASRLSAIYKDSATTVQPPAAGLIPQIRYE